MAIPGDSTIHTLSDLQGKTFATSFPNILQSFLDTQHLQGTIITMSGSVEIAPSMKMADAIADIVSSGNTLIQNGLKEFHTISDFEAVLIQHTTVFDDEKKNLLGKLLMRIDAIIEAKKYKYIVMNIPKTSLSTFTELL
ncbi:MAG: ATP phosphoribosyltransferase [Candidatus Peribacteria bacterium]|nr:ATP phosphoribosyltransferase [Candidatus Peribacteria bacterium]